jgi:hypothetical protein
VVQRLKAPHPGTAITRPTENLCGNAFVTDILEKERHFFCVRCIAADVFLVLSARGSPPPAGKVDTARFFRADVAPVLEVKA